jgi:hypothetical protein
MIFEFDSKRENQNRTPATGDVAAAFKERDKAFRLDDRPPLQREDLAVQPQKDLTKSHHTQA